jgi:hypothetical protein
VASLSTITVSNPSTAGADLALNGTTYNLSANAAHDLKKVVDRIVGECTASGATLHGASPTVTPPTRW